MTWDRTAELQLMLQDWGQPVLHRAVARDYHPATQQVTETATETSLTALVGTEASAVAAGTAGQHRSAEQVFLTLQADWPETPAGQVQQLVWAGGVYELSELRQSSAAGWLEVTGRRRN